MAVKSTDIELRNRLLIVYKMVIEGYSKANIVRYGSEKWKIGERQIEDYLFKVKDKIKETYSNPYKESILNTHLAQLDDLYRKSYEFEDFKECRAILESRGKLLGLNEPEKIDLSTKDITPPVMWTDSNEPNK